jgi:DNA-binding NarL/FixJ family response regulator
VSFATGASSPDIRVVVADDQAAVREGPVMLLGLLGGIEVVGAAADGAEALDHVRRLQPDVVLMDLRMPRVDGVAATAAIARDHPATQVVVLTTYADDASVEAALAAGAIGFLTKDAGRDDIRRALEAAAAGQALLDRQVQRRLLEGWRSAPGSGGRSEPPEIPQSAAAPDGLTGRELEVLRLIAEGLANSEIAGKLYVSEATVKTHINHIFAKTGCRDRAQAVAYAHRIGLAGPG